MGFSLVLHGVSGTASPAPSAAPLDAGLCCLTLAGRCRKRVVHVKESFQTAQPLCTSRYVVSQQPLGQRSVVASSSGEPSSTLWGQIVFLEQSSSVPLPRVPSAALPQQDSPGSWS